MEVVEDWIPFVHVEYYRLDSGRRLEKISGVEDLAVDETSAACGEPSTARNQKSRLSPALELKKFWLKGLVGEAFWLEVREVTDVWEQPEGSQTGEQPLSLEPRFASYATF
ncbi:MAG TPA: hypothetical protein DEH78_28955 [Solibacterales bacterium]|nr:hypothetical protein [Bryobacterales bacterium]